MDIYYDISDAGPFHDSNTLYLQVDDDGDVIVANYCGVGPGMPEALYSRKWWYLAELGTTAVADDVERICRERADTLREIAEGWRGLEWNGSNRVGRWVFSDDETLELSDRVESWFRDGHVATYWEAVDWYSQCPVWAENWRAANLDALVIEVEADALADGVHLSDVREYLAEQLVRGLGVFIGISG